MKAARKELVYLHGEFKTPPMSEAARIEAGRLMNRVQCGERLGMPHSRPMPSIGARCHELRIIDEDVTWRVIYRIDAEIIAVAEVFAKKTRATPKHVIDACQLRYAAFDR